MPRTKKDDKKRLNGEGSYYKEAGRWRVAIWYEDATGVKRLKRQWAASERDAKEKLVALQSDLQRGVPIVPEKETLAQFLARWLDDVDVTRTLTTARDYRQKLRDYVVPAIGYLKLAQIAPAHIAALYRQLLAGNGVKGKPLAHRTIDHVHRYLHAALQQALREGLIVRNPASAVTPPDVDEQEEVVLTKAEATRLLLVARDHPRGGPVLVMAGAGLRWGEVAGLRWRDVDIEAGRLRVGASLVWVTSPWFLKEPKRRSRRIVDLPTWAIGALTAQQARQAEHRAAAGDAWTEHDFVFTTATGAPLHQSNYWRDVWRPLLKRAGLTDTGIKRHGLRHTHGTLLREAGVELDVLRDRLGHSAIGTTADTYGHITAKLRRGPADKIEDLLED